MKKMLVLLKSPQDIETHLGELKEIVQTHGIARVYLARVSRAFGARVRSIAAPHKLDTAIRMSSASVDRYFSNIADDLSIAGIDVIPVSTGLQVQEIDSFIRKHDIDLIVTNDGRLGLCQWKTGVDLSRGHVLLLCDHVFGGAEQPQTPEHSHAAKPPVKADKIGGGGRVDLE